MAHLSDDTTVAKMGAPDSVVIRIVVIRVVVIRVVAIRVGGGFGRGR